MCDLGLTLGLVAGVAEAAGQAQAVNQSNAAANKDAALAYAAHEREYLVKAQGASKDAYQAALEGDRAKSAAIVKGEGAMGTTPGLQVAEQGRQSALSIANAQDQRKGADANLMLANQVTTNDLAKVKAMNAVNPLATLTNIATSGIKNYGAFR